MLEVGRGPYLGLYILQVGQGLIDDLQLPLGGGRRLGRGPDHGHLLLLEDAEGLGRVAAGGAGAGGAAGVAGGGPRRDGGARGGGAAADRPGARRFRACWRGGDKRRVTKMREDRLLGAGDDDKEAWRSWNHQNKRRRSNKTV